MKAAFSLTLSILALTACTNLYDDSPARHELTGPVEEVTPTPAPGNPYQPPSQIVSVPAGDRVE